MPATANSPGYVGGWEKVGKGGHSKNSQQKQQNGNNNKFSKTEKQKFRETAPRLEEVLPMSQVNAIRANMEKDQVNSSPKSTKNNKENGKVAPNSPNKKAKDNGKKKDQKQAKEPMKKPKDVQAAIKNIDVNDLKSILAKVKLMYPGNQILWIRDAAAYFNSVLDTEKPFSLDTVFTDKPLAYLTKETKRTVAALLEECNDGARESGFETLLANLAHDLNKNNPVNGYLVTLQLMAEIYPSLAIYNTERYSELRNSYQNRPNVCTALIWSLGQGGRKDLSVGLRVFLDVMLPLITMKNYTRFVSDYLSDLLKEHSSKVKKGVKVIYGSHFLRFLEVIFLTSQGLNKEVKANLQEQYPAIKTVSVGDCSKDHELFPELLRRLHQRIDETEGELGPYEQELVHLLAESVTNNKTGMVQWQRAYITHLPASAALLTYLRTNWDKTAAKKLRGSSDSVATFESFQDYNLKANQNKEGVEEATTALQFLLPKVSQKCGGWGFPWKTLILLFIVGLATTINIDIQRKGSFKASRTGAFLQDVGLYEQTVQAADFTAKSYAKGAKWTRENVPVYRDQARTTVEPYRKIAAAKLDEAYSWVTKTTPIVLDKIEEFLPGAKAKLVMVWNEVCRLSGNGYRNICFFSEIAGNFLYGIAGKIAYGANEAFNGRVTKDDLSKLTSDLMTFVQRSSSKTFKYFEHQIQVLTAGK